MWMVRMPSSIRFKVRLSKRGLVSIPLNILGEAGVELGKPVWIISDGDILIIKTVFQKPRSTYPPIIRRLRGAFRRFVSR